MSTRKVVLTIVLAIAVLLAITTAVLAAPPGPEHPHARPGARRAIPVGSAWGAIVGDRGAAHNVMLPIGDRVPSFTVLPGTTVRIAAEATGIWFPDSQGTLSAHLEVLQVDGQGNTTLLGEDQASDTRAGPDTARGRLVVPITFDQPGPMDLVVRLTARAEPAQGTLAEDVDEIRAQVTVLDPATFGSISGNVTAADTGEPVADAVVAAHSRELRFHRSARTDENGDYRITDLPPGEYIVGVRAPGSPYVGELYDGVRSPEEATPVIVSESAETTGIDFTLDRGGTITGLVTAEDTGEPLAGVAIVIRPAPSQPGPGVQGPAAPAPELRQGVAGSAGRALGHPRPPVGERGRQRRPHPAAVTDEDGLYTVQGLPAGEYIVVAVGLRQGYGVEFYDGASSPEDATPVPVDPGQTVENINFTLAPWLQ